MNHFSSMKYLVGALALGVSSSANAGIFSWSTAVDADPTTGFQKLFVVAPIVTDIGSSYDHATNGMTYEFVVNAPDGPTSSALMGARGTGSTSAGIKWEQGSSSMLGITTFGVADFTSTVPLVADTDVVVAFVMTSGNTDIFVNGALAGNIAEGFTLSGEVGIGQAYDPTGNFDLLTGTILGVAVYDSALSDTTLAAHSNQFFNVVDPNVDGDVDGDFDVDLDDYNILKANFGTGSSLAEGDVDYDGDVDLADYALIAEQYPFFNGGASLASAIPEPTSMLLMGLGCVAMLKRSK